MERIQKVIASTGYCSRRKAEELINDGKIYVNHEKATLGMKINYTDLLEIDGKVIKLDNEDKVYYLINKPRGVVCTASDEKNRKTIVELIDTDKRIYPVGRLDYDTTGAIILTNDGELTNKLTHPSNNIDKVYIAKLKGIIVGEDIIKLRKGILVNNSYKTSPCKCKLRSYDKKTDTSLVEITIHEGHNHQVKDMFKQLGYDVEKLTRTKFSFLDVKNLKSSEYRMLSTKEVKQLYGLCNSSKKVK